MKMTNTWERFRDELRTLVDTRPFGLITDIDGTIAPIIEPNVIPTISASARQALLELSTQIELVAVVTGRGANQAQMMLEIPRGIELIGSHGLERFQNGKAVPNPKVAAFEEPLDQAYEEAERVLDDVDIYLERKSIGFTLHYRGARAPERTRQRVHDLAASLVSRYGVGAKEGRCIVEIGPDVASNKGTAISELIEQYGLASVLYVGDDVSDLDAFRTICRLRGSTLKCAMSIGVASKESPTLLEQDTDFLVEGVPSVAALYQWISSKVFERGDR